MIRRQACRVEEGRGRSGMARVIRYVVVFGVVGAMPGGYCLAANAIDPSPSTVDQSMGQVLCAIIMLAGFAVGALFGLLVGLAWNRELARREAEAEEERGGADSRPTPR